MAQLGLSSDEQIKAVKDAIGLGAYHPTLHESHRVAIVRYLTEQPEDAAKDQEPAPRPARRGKPATEVEKMFNEV
jgi:hypothetical protein